MADAQRLSDRTVDDAGPLSLGGRRWTYAVVDHDAAARFAQAAHVPEPIARLLLARGVAPADAAAYLQPRLRDLLPDPSIMADAERAAQRIAEAVMRGQTLAVFGDYDVDGAASTALLVSVLRHLGATVLHAVPDRIRDGYGPNIEAFRRLVDGGAGLIICVDCGSSAHAPIAAISDVADVVVIDHHVPTGTLPAARAIVNPNRDDDTSGLGHLCAAGVAFLVLVALVRSLRDAGWFSDRREPDLLDALDLVAIATVCDVVPMRGLNRAFVDRGLARIVRNPRPGFTALAAVAGLTKSIDVQALGFAIGPRLNAAGRLADAALGVRLLLAEDTTTAEALAARLDDLNRDRQTIERAVLAEALAAAEDQAKAGLPVIVVASPEWHEGVVGIVAGRLRELLHRPAFVFSVGPDAAKGSGRSVPGVHLGQAVQRAVAAGLARRGGGHALAAGATVDPRHIADFQEALCRACNGGGGTATPRLTLAGRLTPEGADAALADMVARLGPFGTENEEPHFAVSGLLSHVARMGRDGATLGLTLTGESGVRLRGVLFRADDGPLGEGLIAARGHAVTLAGRVRRDDFRGGDAVCIQVSDAAPA